MIARQVQSYVELLENCLTFLCILIECIIHDFCISNTLVLEYIFIVWNDVYFLSLPTCLARLFVKLVMRWMAS